MTVPFAALSIGPDDDPLAPFVPSTDSPWDARKAAHLLRRAGFGAPTRDVGQAVADGLEQTVEKLLSFDSTRDDFEDLREAVEGTLLDLGNPDALKAWWLYRMQKTARPLEEKLTLFWHGHFATSNSKVDRTDLMQAQNRLLRRHALGPFRRLLVGIAKDPAMIVWLDSNTNKKGKPNENFARELLELFTMGPGAYTETDVMEVARAFTGWHAGGGVFRFNAAEHDSGTKTILGETGSFDGEDVIDIVLRRPETARFIAGKLYAAFCHPDPDEWILQPLGDQLLRSQYSLKDFLRRLFLSRAFYSARAYRAVVKSPVELIVGAARELDSHVSVFQLVRAAREMGQDLFYPPSVKGWEGGSAWLGSAAMLERINFAKSLAHARSVESGSRIQPDEICARHKLDSPDKVLSHFLKAHLQDDIAPETAAALREYLTHNDGGKDRPWTNDGRTFNSKVRGLIHLVLASPEYQFA